MSDVKQMIEELVAAVGTPKYAYNCKEFTPGKDTVFYSGPYWDEKEVIAGVTAFLTGKWLVSGENVAKFQWAFCRKFNVKHAHMVNSGSSANLTMVAALKKHLGWKDGAEVIVSPVGFPTTIAPLVQNGLTPVFVDIEMDTLNFNLDNVEKWITDKTVAVFVSPVLGNPPDMDRIAKFCAENARLPDWKIDIINIVRDESQYFFPQIQTKIANEGWASFTHYHICHELDLPADMHFAMLKTHNQVVRPHIGGINPYHLGFHLFQKILERHGYEECLIARESLNDASFIGQYLTEEDCYELNLFSYSKKFNGATFIDDISDKDGWKLVKKELIANVAGASIPVVAVSELKSDGTLILRHEHDGRDLELSYARKVGEHIRYLWNSPVHFITKVDGESSRFEL